MGDGQVQQVLFDDVAVKMVFDNDTAARGQNDSGDVPQECVTLVEADLENTSKKCKQEDGRGGQYCRGNAALASFQSMVRPPRG